jgi:alpha-beta hydrolase superfamily lysophospholipase
MITNRKEIRFASGGEDCAAWLYPAAAEFDSAPAIVMAHGLSGTRRDRLGAFAERFAAAGIAAFVFDYRGFGDSDGEADLFEPQRQLVDWRAAIAFVRSLEASMPAGWRRSGPRLAAATRSRPRLRIELLPWRSARSRSWIATARPTVAIQR